MEYLGSLGRLIPFRCASSERTGAGGRYVESFTVEGARRVQAVPARPRVWDVSWGARDGGELAKLESFVSGAWGHGPWHWVSVAAQTGNLLTPREALLLDRAGVSSASVQDAGPVRDSSGGWFPRSVTVALDSGWVALVRGVPVHPDKPFTFSCDVEGAGTAPHIHMAFYDAAGGLVQQFSQIGSGTAMQRVSRTVPVPAGAVSAHVGVRNTVARATRPQVTWTAGPVPFSAGHGCRSAVVDGVSSDLLVVNSSGPVSGVGFTVLEVA